MSSYSSSSCDAGESSSPETTYTVFKECLKTHKHSDRPCKQFKTTAEKNSLETVFCICGCYYNDHRMVELPAIRRRCLPIITTSTFSKLAGTAAATTAPPPPSPPTMASVSDDVVVVDEGEGMKTTPVRLRMTGVQRERVREYAESVGWSLRKENKGKMFQLCEEIGITPEVCRNWINNNRRKLPSTKLGL